MSSEPSRVFLLGVPIDPVTQEQAVTHLQNFLTDGRQHHVMTPNSEMLVEANRNTEFFDVLQSSDLNLPDSAGLLSMARWTGQRLPERVTGVDTVLQFCRRLSEDHPIFLLGAGPGVAEKAAEKLKAMNPRLIIAATHSGSPSASDVSLIIEKIRATKPQVLFVAFGAPGQDLWIAEHLKDLPSVRIAMGVGGTFDFLAGKRKRAPVILQKLSLEWLWRLCLEPSRWKRIWTAVVVCPWMVLRYGRTGVNKGFSKEKSICHPE